MVPFDGVSDSELMEDWDYNQNVNAISNNNLSWHLGQYLTLNQTPNCALALIMTFLGWHE